MPPRGRGGNFRGRGGRGRGRGGRGGKATSRFGPNRRFDGTRLADNDESQSSGSESESAPEDTVMEDIDSEDDDDEHTTSSKPYMALLQSFSNDSSAPDAKRRKLNHKNSTQSQPEQDSSGEESHADDQDEDTEKDIDRAEDEAEEEAEEKLDDNEDSEDEENPTDPFDVHFAHPNDDAVSQRVKSVQNNDWATKRALLQNMRATILCPGSDTGSEIPKPIAGLEGLQLKQKLRETSTRKIGDFDALQRNLGPLVFNYNDVLFCDRTVRNSDSLRELACLHALNHVFKRTRDRVIKNNYKLAKEGQDADLELRDQGFTRPKVLFLLPTRNSALRMVNMIRDICEPDQQENRKRFDDGYVDKEAKFGADRPADFKDLFEGSDDDMFRLGMKFTRKTIKYFAQFYNSDILFASPLGLRMAIGSEEDKKLDFDFLSSIEMVIVDQADALLMQNWEHVEFIFEHMNLQPKDAHGCDFSRVRNWYLEDWAKYFRQTIIMSAFNTPELSELLRLHCHNWAGKVRLQPEYPGMLSQLGIKAKQTFSRFQSSSVDKDPDARFEYFTSAIVPSLAKRAKDATGTLIFIPSYLDFVRVRNYFATSSAVENVTFGAISEYADVPEASRARSHFLNGRHRVLLYTERAHHFRRYQFRGVQRVIFYGLPDKPIFYTEIAGGYLSKSEQDLRLEPGQGTVKVVFSKYDVMKLERIVGSKRVGKMIQDRGDTFEFI
ncbi:u3 small nucleolar RNA-associated 25 [Fusarium tjaetaba]|uniref:U3 small nucleolar RNA-associated protein 25 n=1 Tax=Fusarium tjaetaba TaxID=1567544 RepID=A0A8H5R5F9_9HYPO|nr:u3 small nucleolar RNA-associated 25 [Fusarium tjaetaba]KAF5626467.1 u3 small nucleolar RNA-associated 25 [Fusarium tjaetaba]